MNNPSCKLHLLFVQFFVCPSVLEIGGGVINGFVADFHIFSSISILAIFSEMPLMNGKTINLHHQFSN